MHDEYHLVSGKFLAIFVSVLFAESDRKPGCHMRNTKPRPFYALGITAEIHLRSSRHSLVGCSSLREITACGENVDKSV